MKRWSALLFTVVSTLAQASYAADPRADAAALSRKGKEAYALQDYKGAAEAFEASYDAVPRAAAIYNAALAWVLAKDPVRAANAFRTALYKTDLHGAESDNARAELGKLENELGYVEITAPNGSQISVPPLQKVLPPASTYLRPGDHEIEVTLSDGQQVKRRIQVLAGKRRNETFDGPVVVLRNPDPVIEAKLPVRVKESEGGKGSPLRTVGWVLLGVSAASAGGAIYLGTQAVSSRDAFVATGNTSQDLHDDAVRYRTMTNVTWVGCAVTGALGLAFVLLGGK